MRGSCAVGGTHYIRRKKPSDLSFTSHATLEDYLTRLSLDFLICKLGQNLFP